MEGCRVPKGKEVVEKKGIKAVMKERKRGAFLLLHCNKKEKKRENPSILLPDVGLFVL